MREHHAAVAEQLRAIEPRARAARERTGERCPHLTLEWGIALEEFFVEWCSQAERRLADTHSPVDRRR